MRLLLLGAVLGLAVGCGGSGGTKVEAPESYQPPAQPASVGTDGGSSDGGVVAPPVAE